MILEWQVYLVAKVPRKEISQSSLIERVIMTFHGTPLESDLLVTK